LFVAAEFGIIDFDDAATSQKAITGTVGYEIPTESAAHICIGGTSTYAFGLEFPGADITTFQVNPVVAVGLEAELSPAVSVVPFGTLAWFYRRNSIDAGVGSVTEPDNLGAVRLGASFVFNERFAITPHVELPVGVDGGGDTIFSARVVVGLGGSD
jgi:hypothetical protein